MTEAADAGLLHTKLEAAWKLIEIGGHAGSVAAIRERLAVDTDGVPSVVVVGETNRGKSSLVNALIGRAVAPVGADVVTAAYVSYVPATLECEVPPGTARIVLADGSSERVPAGEVADWVTVSGRHAGDERGVLGAIVHLDQPGLVDMVLIDTPGVGGLRSGHASVALRVARQASALLFVTDAGGDLTVPELGFIQDAAASVDVVAFAVTKADTHPETWQTRLDHTRQLLAQHSPRFQHAPLMAVSSTMAIEASQSDDLAVAEALAQESGISDLISTLTALVSSRSEQLATRNALRATVTALRGTEAFLRERIAAASDAGTSPDLLASKRTELKELQQYQRRWGREFDLAMSRLRRSLVESLNDTIPEIEHRWRTQIVELSQRELLDGAQQRERLERFSGEITSWAAGLLDGYSESVAEQVELLLTQDPELAQSLTGPVKDRIAAVGPGAVGLPPVQTPQAGQVAMRALLPGAGIAKMAVLSGVSAGFFIPGTVALGLVFGTVFRSGMKADAARTQLREHIGKTLQRTQSAVLLQADGFASELRPRLLDAMEDHLERRGDELNQLIREAERAARAEPAERAKRIQPLQRTLATVVEAIADLEAVLDEFASGTWMMFGASNGQSGSHGPG